MAVTGAFDGEAVTASVADVDVVGLDDAELARFIVQLEVVLNATHAASAVALEEFQRRGSWVDEGCLSAASWVAGRTGTRTQELRARVRAGAGLRLLPSAAGPARAGRFGPRHLVALAECARRHPQLAVRDEDLLVGQAQALDADRFGAAARQWQECAAAVDGTDPSALRPAEPVDELHLSRTFDGRYQLDGSFSAGTGQLLEAAIGGEVDRALRDGRDGDPSVPLIASQVRAAALVDLIAQTMRREPSEQSIPDRYRVAVVVNHDPDVPPLAACDASAFRVVLGARSEILDVGRLTQQWPPGIRRAITHRDGGCVFPGCDRPPSWTDIHHRRPWKEGGSTSVSNGALLCRRHHTFIHQQLWVVGIEDGRPIIRKPDGTPHRITRWDTAPPYRLDKAG